MQLGKELSPESVVTEARDLKREFLVTNAIGVASLAVGTMFLFDVLIESSMYTSGMMWTHLAIGGSFFLLGVFVLYFLNSKVNEKINAIQKNFFS